MLEDVQNLVKDGRVIDILEELTNQVKEIIGDNLVGIYLHGSLALGDFDPATSDIDFMVVVNNSLDDQTVEKIKQMHQSLIEGENEWGKKLEGSYLTVEQLKSAEPPFDPRPYINEKNFYSAADYGYEWVLEKYVVREKGVVLSGPDPKEIIDRVEVDEVIAAVKIMFAENWLPILTNSKKLETEWYQPYTILTLCRMMYTVEKGKIGSKREAAEWAIKNFGDRWGDLVDLARNWRRGDSFDQQNKILPMIDFVRDFLKR